MEALHKLAQLQVQVIVITNQSAIGRGATTQKAVHEIHHHMQQMVAEAGGKIDDLFLCPHHPEAHCNCRKPKPGLLLQAAARYQLDLRQCIFVGDAITDYQAALAAHCQSILVKTGRQASQVESLVGAYLARDTKAYRPEIVDNLSAAVDRMAAHLAPRSACFD